MHTRHGQLREGLTLIEIMIVVTVIGFLVTMAIPGLRETRRRAQDTRFINDLRILTDNVFEQYAMENKGYPPDAPPGVAPTGIVPYLARRLQWDDGPVIGGQWNWDRGATRADTINGVYASIEIVAAARTAAQMRDIDREIDDGDLVTGHFRQTPGGYMRILEP